ncbi:MAG: hypothetical protein ABIK44_00230 [candidate division WOR-3 bacterium]
MSCGTEPPPPWPWWTSEDSVAVRAELAKWEPVMTTAYRFADTFRLGISSKLAYQDSSSKTGDTLYKFAHVLRAWVEPWGSVHDSTYDIYQFGVTVDTVSMNDTFCEVAYRDSMSDCRVTFEFDSLWVVGYRPDTTIDTTRTPPETTIVYRVTWTEKRGFANPVTATKTYSWSAMRKLFLRLDTTSQKRSYRLCKTTGVAISTPTSEQAPAITRLIMSKPGADDTFFYAPRADGRGLYNLRPLDSLYTLHTNEAVTVTVITKTPDDTTAEKNRFFLTLLGTKSDITTNAKTGQAQVAFGPADTGYHHIYIEVLPSSNLLYPNADYLSTVWALPVRVIP